MANELIYDDSNLTLEVQITAQKELNQKSLKRIVRPFLKALRAYFNENHPQARKTHLTVSVLICGNDRMKKLNSSFRNKDRVTDVLSFPASDQWKKNRTFLGEDHLGDIAICSGKVDQQAKEFAITREDELLHLLVHGVVHLMGYDHELSVKEKKLMENQEQMILALYSKLT